MKIMGVQIVVYGFRTYAEAKSEQIAERCLFFGLWLCTETVQRKFGQRGLQKRGPSTFLVRNPYKPLHGMRARPPLGMASGVHFGATFGVAFGYPFGRPFRDAFEIYSWSPWGIHF